MSFKPAKLIELAHAANFTMWFYETADEDAHHAGYFNRAFDRMRAGDWLIISTDNKPRNFTVTRSERELVVVKAQGREHLLAPGEPTTSNEGTTDEGTQTDEAPGGNDPRGTGSAPESPAQPVRNKGGRPRKIQ